MKLNRRHFLRAAGVSLALPWLGSLAPAFAAAEKPRRRMVCICSPLGLQPAYFFPQQAGKDYELSPYLEVIKEFRNDWVSAFSACAPQASGGFPQHDLAGPVRGGAHPRRDALRHPRPGREPAVLDPQRRAGAKRSLGVERVHAHVHRGASG